VLGASLNIKLLMYFGAQQLQFCKLWYKLGT